MVLSSQIIKELRDKSGAGMLDCKKALEESNGDIDKAIEWLRKKGINTAQKKSSRHASDGLVTIIVEKNTAVLTEVNVETDFVAKNEIFLEFCSNLSSTFLNSDVQDVDSLMGINYFNSNKTVSQVLTEFISKLGENIIIRRVKKISSENFKYQKYLHNSLNENSGKIGVLLVFECDKIDRKVDEFTKNLCMHIAATTPQSIDKENLDKSLIEKERSIYVEQLKSSGKPENIIDKIVEGKINKFYEEVCLYDQFFVMDNKVKINKVIEDFKTDNSINFQISNFFLFKLGQ